MIKELNLFGIPIYIGNLSLDDKEINILINSEYERLKPNNGFKTKNIFILNNKKIKKLNNEIKNHLNIYLYNQLKIKDNIKFKMLNSWCIKHIKDDWAQKHSHSNSFLSGIVYLKTNKNSGNLIFYKNVYWQNIFYKSVDIEFKEYTETNSDIWSITPKNGDIILFPSFLEHSVTYNKSKEDRYSCAFNFYPQGEFGNKNSLNNLNLN